MSIGRYPATYRADGSWPPGEEDLVDRVLDLMGRAGAPVTAEDVRERLGLPRGRRGEDPAGRVLAEMRSRRPPLVKFERDWRGRLTWRRSSAGIARSGRRRSP